MDIQLTTNIAVLGKTGEIVSVGKNLGTGLIRRGQAKLPSKLSADYTASEAAKKVRDMSKTQAKEFTKGEKRKTVLKELKDHYDTKEEKESYKTK